MPKMGYRKHCQTESAGGKNRTMQCALSEKMTLVDVQNPDIPRTAPTPPPNPTVALKKNGKPTSNPFTSLMQLTHCKPRQRKAHIESWAHHAENSIVLTRIQKNKNDFDAITNTMNSSHFRQKLRLNWVHTLSRCWDLQATNSRYRIMQCNVFNASFRISSGQDNFNKISWNFQEKYDSTNF